MALTPFQRLIIRLLASRRAESEDSYLAGGAALTALTGSPRLSRDLDIFHDAADAVARAWAADRDLPLPAGTTSARCASERATSRR